MLVKFFHHGQGSADSATGYLLADGVLKYLSGSRNKELVVRQPRPVVLKGDPERTRRLIGQLRTKHKYVSGVLSFRELLTPEDETKIIHNFEAVAFAGLQSGQFECLIVKHAHQNRTELHFLVPRCELSSGKSLNIRPP